MSDSEIKALLLEELENKKEFNALYDTFCDVKRCVIYEGDTFIFLGNRQKVCDDCFRDIISFVENL